MKPVDEPSHDSQHDASKPLVCRVCHREFDPTAATAPFCSDRCRMADLGKWLSGDYRISRDLKDADLEEGD